jgi:hypothetical protein
VAPLFLVPRTSRELPSSDKLDAGAVARGIGRPRVAREQRSVEDFGQGDVGRIVGAEEIGGEGSVGRRELRQSCRFEGAGGLLPSRMLRMTSIVGSDTPEGASRSESGSGSAGGGVAGSGG